MLALVVDTNRGKILMTALERAKQFAQSRTAKTTLKVLPFALALATVPVRAHAQSSGGGTPVPEPSSIVLTLGAAAAAAPVIVNRIRKSNKK